MRASKRSRVASDIWVEISPPLPRFSAGDIPPENLYGPADRIIATCRFDGVNTEG
jgi:hypothetical protein